MNSLSQSGRVEALAFRRRLQHARRRLSLWDGRLPARRAYRIRDAFASGVDNEVSPPSPEWRGGDESARPDPGHLCAAGGEHHERACGQRPRAPVRVDSEGLRPGELLALHWGSFDNEAISVSERLYQGKFVTP